MNENWKPLNSEIIACRKCQRLVKYRERIAQEKRRAYRGWEYWGKPVPGFGDPNARVVLIGLAPGAHGSNRTGRMFTGDGSGDFLYPALHRAGFASQPISRNMELLKRAQVVVALGRIAFDGYLRLLREQGCDIPRFEFKHAAVYALGNQMPTLICSYHPSRQNTQTGRLTVEMFDSIFEKAKKLL